MRIVIHDYTIAWPQRFVAERIRLHPVLPTGATIEHIGSTSVPGLAAKDIIDIVIGLPDFDAQAAQAVPRVIDLGFIYLPKYEDVMPFRRFFYRSENGQRCSQIHMVGFGTQFWIDHLLFRDYLRNSPAACTDYAALKRNLATREWQGFNDYTEEETDFILAALAKAKVARGTVRTSIIFPAGKPKLSYCDWEPRYSEVVQSFVESMPGRPEFLSIEHVGSTSISSCGGKGVIDLLALYPDGRREETKSFLLGVGFVPQGPEFVRRWTNERPMYLGYFGSGRDRILIYIHVVAESSDEVRRFRAFRDRLRENPSLVSEYCALKRKIVEAGVMDTDDYAVRKRAFMHRVLGEGYALRPQASSP